MLNLKKYIFNKDNWLYDYNKWIFWISTIKILEYMILIEKLKVTQYNGYIDLKKLLFL